MTSSARTQRRERADGARAERGERRAAAKHARDKKAASRRAKVDQRKQAAAARQAERRGSRRVKFSNRDYVPMRLPPFHETSANIQGLYPFIAEAGIDAPGILMGRNLLSSGSFTYDVFELYKRGMLLNPNGLIQGTVGSGKSSLVKTTVLRDAAFGIRSVVPCDPPRRAVWTTRTGCGRSATPAPRSWPRWPAPPSAGR
jgi:hypothetical protein